jgi:N-acyl-L-homoserine lactone synthetase
MMTCRAASTQEEREAILRQRHDVFVEELEFFAPREKGIPIESDDYDDHSVFLGVWEDNELLASCRLIFEHDSFVLPTLNAILIDSPLYEAHAKTAEISRLTIASPYRSFKKSIQIFKVMQEELDRVSVDHEINQLIASVEPTFLHLINRARLPYQSIGPLQHYIKFDRYPIILKLRDRIALSQEGV